MPRRGGLRPPPYLYIQDWAASNSKGLDRAVLYVYNLELIRENSEDDETTTKKAITVAKAAAINCEGTMSILEFFRIIIINIANDIGIVNATRLPSNC